jgi:hypothetical protein
MLKIIVLGYAYSGTTVYSYIIYPWKKSSSVSLKWWLGTAGIEAGISRVTIVVQLLIPSADSVSTSYNEVTTFVYWLILEEL